MLVRNELLAANSWQAGVNFTYYFFFFPRTEETRTTVTMKLFLRAMIRSFFWAWSRTLNQQKEETKPSFPDLPGLRGTPSHFVQNFLRLIELSAQHPFYVEFPLALDQTKGCVPFSTCSSSKGILFCFLQVRQLKLCQSACLSISRWFALN